MHPFPTPPMRGNGPSRLTLDLDQKRASPHSPAKGNAACRPADIRPMAPQPPLDRSTPLLTVADAWLAHFSCRVRQQQRDSHTLDCYRRDLKLFGVLGSRPVSEILPPEIIAWHETLCETQTSARAHAFGYARRRGLVTSNPASRLDICHRAQPARPLTAEEVVQWRVGLAELERQRCARAFGRDTEPRRLLGLRSSIQALRLLELTGRRLSEICSIPVHAVRMRARVILLESTKTGPSAVPLASDAVELVSKQLEHLAGQSPWLFPSTSSPSHIGPNAVWETFHLACGLAGIRGANPHDLRHGWVWTAMAEGASWDDVSAAIGHRSIATTKKVYANGMLVFPGMFTAARRVQLARDAAAREAQ